MRIEASFVDYVTRHAAFVEHTTKERVSLRLSRDEAPPSAPRREAAHSASAQAVRATQREIEAKPNDAQLQLLIALIERITGRKVVLFDGSRLWQGHDSASATSENESAMSFELVIHRQHVTMEGEDLRFSAAGYIRTSDGRHIEIGLELMLSRQSLHIEENVAVLSAGRRKDPLVLDLVGSHPADAPTAEYFFYFDLDADGQREWLPLLPKGQGLLAHDGNQNGRIDDGRELFGPRTGAGFAELSRYDDDGNGWIDEADAVFARLRVWFPEQGSGEGKLFTLQDLGIGALSTHSVAASFSYRSSSQVETAQLKRLGMYLYENGMAATMREIDLIV